MADPDAKWPRRQMSEVATLQRGFDLPVQSRSAGNFPIFAANGAVGQHSHPKVCGPGVVTGRSGTLGRVHYVSSDFWPLNTALWVKDFHGNCPRWIFWLLQSLRLERFSRGVGVPTLNRNLVHEVSVAVPPLPEQKRIARILDAADALRAKRRKSIAQLDALVQSTFLEMFGDPSTNTMGWDQTTLGSVAIDGFRNGLSPSAKGHVEGRVLTLSAVTRGRFDSAASKKAVFDRVPAADQTVGKKRFLICRGNGNKSLVGAGVFPDEDIPQTCFPDTIISLTVDQDVLMPRYLEQVWRSRLVRDQIERGARTTNGTFKVNQALLSSVHLPTPPIQQQAHFELVVQGVEGQRKSMLAHLAELDTLFASLQSRAFAGEL